MSRRYEVGVGCLVVVAAGLLAYMALQVGAIASMRPSITVEAVLPDAAGLSEGAVVSVAGVQVGRVEALATDFDRARATLSLYADAGLRRDARLAVRARSVLGEKYLQIVPVSREAELLREGDVIDDVAGQVEIDQMVTRMAPLVDAVDPEALGVVIAALSSAIEEDPERPKRMLADAERALHNAAEASEELPALAREARATLASVKRTSDEARPVVARLDATAQRLDALVAAVPPEQVPALLAEIELAVNDGRAVIEKIDGSTADLRDLLATVNGITAEDLQHWARDEGVLIRLTPRKRKD